jgi:L-amino acid N-acyltransferase YncA
MLIRDIAPADLAAVAEIYGHNALNGTGTFEESAPGPDQMAERVAAVRDLGLPWLVAEFDGRVSGFAYAGAFRRRAAYRYTVEDSVYVSPDAQGKGVGRAVLAAVIARCEDMGLRQMIAVIGDSANAGSIGLHSALGFQMIGTHPAVGYKFGRWLDVVMMQRPLNGGEVLGPGLRLD